jgi:hypothetical protein
MHTYQSIVDLEDPLDKAATLCLCTQEQFECASKRIDNYIYRSSRKFGRLFLLSLMCHESCVRLILLVSEMIHVRRDSSASVFRVGYLILLNPSATFSRLVTV